MVALGFVLLDPTQTHSPRHRRVDEKLQKLRNDSSRARSPYYYIFVYAARAERGAKLDADILRCRRAVVKNQQKKSPAYTYKIVFYRFVLATISVCTSIVCNFSKKKSSNTYI